MQVERKKKPKFINFKDVGIGESFVWDNLLFIKINTEERKNTFCINENRLTQFYSESNTEVEVITAKVVILD